MQSTAPARTTLPPDATVPRREFFGELESLRGIAALLVVLYHIPKWYEPIFNSRFARNGHAAVEFFFVLSGFVLYHSYSSRIPDVAALKRFTLLRWKRLYPVHFVFTMAFFAIEAMKLLGHMGGENSPSSLISILRALAENLFLIQGLGLATREVFLNFPSWSISTEFYTYLIFGVAVCALTQRSFARLSLLLTLGCCLALATVGEQVGEFQQMLRCVAGFFLGCMTRIVYGAITVRGTRVDWTLVLLLLGVVALNIDWHDRIGAWKVVFPMSVGIILTLVLNPTGTAHALLGSAPFRWLGEISYSLYMCHALVLYLARHLVHREITSLPLGLALYAGTFSAVIVGGWITYLTIERPAKRWLRSVGATRAAAS